MRDSQWREVLVLARRTLGQGYSLSWASESWCAYTTFASLSHLCVYWQNGLPDEGELEADKTSDGGLWRQSFKYSDLAHIVFPASFGWERSQNGEFTFGQKEQSIHLLAEHLRSADIPHRLTDLVLEVKLY